MSESERIHVTPQWEHHESVLDCWCEPTVKEDGNLIVHHAKTCKEPYRVHHWVWRPHPDKPYLQRMECLHCGQDKSHVLQEYER